MENMPAPVVSAEAHEPSGFLHDLAWFFSGAVLPMGSLSFYRKATKRSVGFAILFFFTFTIFISILATISLGVTMAEAVNRIHQAYAQGQIPNITISGGVATVDGPQPAIFLDQRSGSNTLLVAADTTGRLTQIDQSVYSQGFLLTRTELHILSKNQGYQRVPLSELQTAFSADPININEQTVSTAWVTFSAAISVLAFIGLVLWNSVVRLMIIAMLALILWGVWSLFRRNIGYGPFIITGLYAIVPAIYLSHLFSRSQASFPFLQTILLMIFWVVGLVGALSDEKFFAMPIPARLWTALIGVPMLLWLILDMFAKLPSPTGEIILWALVVMTGAMLAIVRLYFHLTGMQSPPAPVQPIPPQSPAPPSLAP
jgi:hypothetical protein